MIMTGLEMLKAEMLNRGLSSQQIGSKVLPVVLAVKRPFSKDETDFIDCVAWRNNADFICKYFEKGQRIECNGHIETRTDRSKEKYGENKD